MSSLFGLLNLAHDGAAVSRASAHLATENLIGSSDPNYVKRISDPELQISSGRIGGILAGAPQRVIDDKVVSAKRDQHSSASAYGIKQEYLELLDNLNGGVDSKGSLNQKLLDVSQKMATLTIDAQDPTLRRNVIESMKGFLTTVRNFAEGINTQRNSVEGTLISSLKQIEVLSKSLLQLNKEISSATYSGQDLSNLENKRDGIIEDIAKLINVQTVRADNNIYLYTSTGKALVESKVYTLSYSSSGVIDYSSAYPTNINPINLENDLGQMVDITTEITGGKMGGAIELRDKIYPDFQKTIDKFTEVFQQQINHVHNEGTGFPPPSELSGRLFVADVDRHTPINWKADGIVRIGIVDKDGNFVDVGNGEFYLDLNLNEGGAAELSPTEIRDKINTHFGIDIASFSAGDYGYLNLKAPGDLRVGIGSVDGAISGETTTGVGFSEYFKLNDLLQSAPDSQGRGYANSIQLRPDVSHDIRLFSVGKLNSRTDIGLGGAKEQTMGVTAGDGTNLVPIRSLINSPQLVFPSAGVLTAQTTSFLSYLTDMVNIVHLDTAAAIDQKDFADTVLDGLERRFSMISGVNKDEESATLMKEKIYYMGVLTAAQHAAEMLKELIEMFSKA
jgi:flagellar hook-associated protein 1 FlgK